VRTVVHDYTRECKVKSGGKEDRGDGEADDLAGIVSSDFVLLKR
jgi:hypothetical protein